MKALKRLVSLLAATGLVVGMLATTAGTALADGSHISPSAVESDTTTLYWSGQGAPVTQVCDPADPGAGGYQNGATADSYLLWIFTTDGGGISGSPTLTVDGTTYGDAYFTNGVWQIVTPGLDVPGIQSAYATFAVASTGSGAWVLTISHGCGTNTRPPADDLTVSKDAAGSYDQTFSWTIAKAVDKTYVELTSATSATFNYTVTVTHDAGVNSNVKVTGTITVTNPNAASVDINGVTDQLSDGTVCAVADGGAQTLASGNTEFSYECDLSAVPTSDLTNTASVSWGDQDLSDGSHLAAASASFTTGVILFAANAIDDCVNVTDTIAGTLGTVCVGDANPTSFTYANQVPAPALGSCVDVDNTATFTTNDTKTTGSDSKTVTVCRFNAPLTPGYWKNHAANAKSGGQYSSTLCKTLKYSSCSNNGVWTIQYLPQTLGTFTVANIGVADGIWGQMNCSSSSDQGAVGCLAGHLLAAKLNVANIANPCISPTITSADAFLTSVGYSGPTWVGSLTPAQRALAISLKSTLDKYNNGGGC